MTKQELELKYSNLQQDHYKLQQEAKRIISEKVETDRGYKRFFDRAIRAENMIRQLKTELDNLHRQKIRLEARLDACLYAMSLMTAHAFELQTKTKELNHPFKPEDVSEA